MYSETSSSILNRMLGNVPSDVDKSEGSLIYDAISPTSQELAQQEVRLDEIVDKFDIENLFGDELEQRIYQRTGITRKLATYAHTIVTVVGNGTITIGDLCQTPGGLRFKFTESLTVSGTDTLNVQAIVAGSSGIVPSGQITQFPVAIPGIVSITNVSPTADGFDAENDASLRQRYYDRIQTPPTQGNIAQFTNLAKEYTGVGDVKIYPTWDGNNTVKLVIIDANKQPPSSDLVSLFQSYIDPSIQGLGLGAAPFGAFTTAAGATGKTINISFTVVKDTNYTDAQRLTNVNNSLIAYFKTIAYKESAVSYAKIGAAILASAGVLDHSGLTVNTGIANISLSYTSSLTEVPVLGAVTIA